jgi:hypothetical protein
MAELFAGLGYTRATFPKRRKCLRKAATELNLTGIFLATMAVLEAVSSTTDDMRRTDLALLLLPSAVADDDWRTVGDFSEHEKKGNEIKNGKHG